MYIRVHTLWVHVFNSVLYSYIVYIIYCAISFRLMLWKIGTLRASLQPHIYFFAFLYVTFTLLLHQFYAKVYNSALIVLNRLLCRNFVFNCSFVVMKLCDEILVYYNFIILCIEWTLSVINTFLGTRLGAKFTSEWK